jgi:hypothetical protein
MAIYRREHLAPYLQELDTYYQALRQAVEGQPPNANTADQYHANPAQFEREFRDVDLRIVKRQIAHFKASVDFVKNLEKDSLDKVAR